MVLIDRKQQEENFLLATETCSGMLSIKGKSVTLQVLTSSNTSVLGMSTPGSDSELLGLTLQDGVYK